MSRALAAFHDSVNGRITELAGVGFGIGRFNGRSEYDVRAQALEKGAVGFQIAGIGVQVTLVVKLRGIDKYADHCHVVFAHRARYQRGVTSMECAHCGHQTNGFLRFALGSQGLVESDRGCDNLHLCCI